MEWKQKTLLERIQDRWDSLESVYSRLKTARENICTFFRPDLGIDYDEDADMLMLGSEITEGSGPWVARTASTAFQGNTVSKKLDWYNYRFSDDKLNGIDILDRWRQDLKDHTSSVYQRSNFYDIQPQFTLDGWTVGSPLFFIEEDDGRAMCIPLHYLTYRLFYDRFNKVEGLIIKDTEWTAKKCFDVFCPGKNLASRLKEAERKFTKNLYQALKNGQLNERVTIWRAVFKSGDLIWDAEDGSRALTRPLGRKKWLSVYFQDEAAQRFTEGSDPGNEPLLTDGYFSMPFVNWDYDKKTWESAARTPAFYSIYDEIVLIQIFRNWIDNTQMRVRPPISILLGTEDRIDMRPGKFSKFKKEEWGYLPKPLENIGEVKLEKEQIDFLRESLSRHFHLELFRMFTDLAQTKNQEFRVLQLVEMAGERVTMLLPAIESHESYLYQVDERIRAIEMQAGRGPFSRDNLENIADVINYYRGESSEPLLIEPEFVGTLRQAQQRQQKLQPIQYGVGALAEIANAMQDPNYVKFMLKSYETGDAALTAVNFPQDLIVEKTEFDKAATDYAQVQAQREQFAQFVELMKANKGQPQRPELQGQVNG